MAFAIINICQALKFFVSSAIDGYSVMYRALEPIKESGRLSEYENTIHIMHHILVFPCLPPLQ